MRKVFLMVTAAVALSACSTTDSIAEKKPVVSIENDPRIGAEVDRVCTIRHVRGWQDVDNDKDALVVNLINKKSYKLTLAGGCNADWARYRIMIENKTGSHCISRFDRVYTDSQDMAGLHCQITKIEEWYPDKLVEAEQGGEKQVDKQIGNGAEKKAD